MRGWNSGRLPGLFAGTTANESLANLSQHLSSALGSDADMSALKALTMTVRKEALVMAFSDIFLILAVLFFAVLLFAPLAKRPMARAAGGGH